MSSNKQLAKRFDQAGLFDELANLGFNKGPEGWWLYRKRGSFVDVLAFQSVADGKSVRVHVSTVKFDMIEEYSEADFPKGFINHWSNVSALFVTKRGLSYGGPKWKTGTEAELKEAVKKISEIVSDEVLPWFDSIDSNEALYDSVHDQVKEVDNYGSQLKRVLLGE